MALREKTGVIFTQDGHRDGSIALARDLGVLGQFSLLGHNVDLTPEDFQGMMIRAAVANGVSLPAPALRLLDTASIGSLLDGLEQGGLSLNGRRAPLTVVVVDSIQRTPTEN